MTKKIALTAVGPYVGATTLATYLAEHYNFMHISMSTKLIEAYMEDRGISPSMLGTMIDNRERIRPELREFSDRSGFSTDPHWMKFCLASWLALKPQRDVVIEKVRTDQQATALRAMGFTIVELAVKYETQVQRASYEWVTKAELDASLAQPLERGLSEGLIDSILLAEGPVHVYGSYLANHDVLQQGRYQ